MHAWFNRNGKNALRFRLQVSSVLRMVWVFALVQGVLGARVPFLSRHSLLLNALALALTLPVLGGVVLVMAVLNVVQGLGRALHRVHALEWPVGFVVRGQHVMLFAFFLVLCVLSG